MNEPKSRFDAEYRQALDKAAGFMEQDVNGISTKGIAQRINWI